MYIHAHALTFQIFQQFCLLFSNRQHGRFCSYAKSGGSKGHMCMFRCISSYKKKKRNSGIYVHIQLGSEGAETKKWHSFFVEDYWRQIAWRSFVWWCARKGEFKTVSVFCVWAHRIEVHIPIRARENFVVNRWNLLILSGHVLCEHDSSWMRQATEDEVRQELPYRFGSFNPSWRLELVCISLSEV